MRALPIALFLLLGLFCSHWYLGHILKECPPQATIAPTDPGRLSDLGLSRDGAMVFGDYEHFKFAENDNNPDLSANNQAFLDAATKYLKENPDHKIKLTGYYLQSEKSPDSYDNMGVSRAAKIRDLLVAKGFSAERFSLHGEMLGEGANLDKPLTFAVIVPKDNGEQVVEVIQTIDDRTYYFEYGSADFVPSGPFIKYMDEVKAYIAQDANKDKVVYVIGHTDNKGSLALNKRLSKNRANQVRSYIIKQGVKASKIKTDSKWYSEPAATNDTDEGRAKNRRVQVRIK